MTTTGQVTIAGAAVDYVATAGHLNALAPVSAAPQASMFYVAYVRPAPAGTARPLVFFYNGGPGSASVWLHLGSFAPRRIVTDAPATTVPLPFQLVDNAESLIDVADLVFVDAVGTGYSQAIAPFTNQSFWGVDADAALMRDFVARYVAVNGRAGVAHCSCSASRTAGRARPCSPPLMLAAGMRLDGVILQSSVLDYNSNCAVFAPATISCEGFLPSYGMTGAWFGLTTPVPTDADAYAEQLRAFAATTYGPAARPGRSRTPASPTLLTSWSPSPARRSAPGRPTSTSTPRPFASSSGPASCSAATTRASPRRSAAPLAAQGDPSSTLISAPFAAAARSRFVDELHYSATRDLHADSRTRSPSGTSATTAGPCPTRCPTWPPRWRAHPALRVLVGLRPPRPGDAVPADRARPGPRRRAGAADVRAYPGGHMTYLDDASRRRMRADLAAFLPAPPAPAAAAAAWRGRRAPRRRGAAGAAPAAPRPPATRRRGAGRCAGRATTRKWRRAGTPTCRPPCASRLPRRRPKARRSRRWSSGRSPNARRPLPVDVLAAVGLPRVLEVARVLVVARPHGHQDAAFADALVVLLDALFRDAPADQRADDAAGRRTGAGAGDRRGQRAGDDQAEARAGRWSCRPRRSPRRWRRGCRRSRRRCRRLRPPWCRARSARPSAVVPAKWRLRVSSDMTRLTSSRP